MRNHSKKTVAMYIRFGREESAHHDPLQTRQHRLETDVG